MIPEQRIHELAAYASDPCADVQHWLAAQLLAARQDLLDLGVRSGLLEAARDAARAENERLAKELTELAKAVLDAEALRIKSDSVDSLDRGRVDLQIDEAVMLANRLAEAIAAEQTKAAPCFSDLPVYEEPKPAGGGA